MDIPINNLLIDTTEFSNRLGKLVEEIILIVDSEKRRTMVNEVRDFLMLNCETFSIPELTKFYIELSEAEEGVRFEKIEEFGEM